MNYEVIKANSPHEAVSLAMFKPGDLVMVDAVQAVPNSDGTWTVSILSFTPVVLMDPAPVQSDEQTAPAP